MIWYYDFEIPGEQILRAPRRNLNTAQSLISFLANRSIDHESYRDPITHTIRVMGHGSYPSIPQLVIDIKDEFTTEVCYG